MAWAAAGGVLTAAVGDACAQVLGLARLGILDPKAVLILGSGESCGVAVGFAAGGTRKSESKSDAAFLAEFSSRTGVPWPLFSSLRGVLPLCTSESTAAAGLGVAEA